VMQGLVHSFAMRQDVVDFCLHPFTRLTNLERWHKYAESAFNNYPGQQNCLEGIKLRDGLWTRGKANVTDMALERLNRKVFTPFPKQTGRRQTYNSFWLNKLVDRYASSRTRLVFIEVPTDPIARAYPIPQNYGTLNSIKQRSKVQILPE